MSKPPSWSEIRTNAREFATRWEGTSEENAEAQTFWNEFLAIFGIDRKRVATFEAKAMRVSTGGRGRIDLLWPGILVAEHKSTGRDLAAAEAQALDYLESVDIKDFPGVVVTSDFANFRVRDLGGDNTPYTFALSDLSKEIDRFGFIAGYRQRKFGDKEEELANIKAARLMGDLYEELARTGYEGHDASVLMTRLLLLMFADDTGMWEKGLFAEFIATRTQPDGSDLGAQLAMLFQVLDKAETSRPSATDELLLRFPYVNGHLFSDRIDIPTFDRRMRDELVRCSNFDWSKISPAVFGSLFQAVKSKEARRTLGEHYTTEHNILRALAPLFLDDLWLEYQAVRDNAQRLERLHDKLANIRVLDPACGCGNFLVIAYRELRRLELAVLTRLADLRQDNQLHLDVSNMVRVRLSHFYGIEVEEWPARIAETAMFLVDQQSNHDLAVTFGNAPDRLPIMNAANIVIGNALQVEWGSVIPIDDNVFVVSNPPFSGTYLLTAPQKEDLNTVWAGVRGGGNMDLVSCWHALAARHLSKSKAKAAFVSTNSITQGQQASVLGAEFERCGVDIDFAHQTFSWTSEAPGQAAVHCAIIGFSAVGERKKKTLYRYPDPKGEPLLSKASNINAYLHDAPNVLVTNRGAPLQAGVQLMDYGSKPTDGGFLSDVSQEDVERIRRTDPVAAKYLRQLVGAQELINHGQRWCLWLKEADPSEIRSSPELLRRSDAVRTMRQASTKKQTRSDAATPHLFQEDRQPTTQFLAIPIHSSQTRKYVPMAIFSPDVITNNAVLNVSNATLYTFGMLHSSVFMAWNAAVSGRIKSDYRISAEVTYNNFPWPEAPKNKDAIEASAQAVLDARELYPNASLADLYDPRSMPKPLVDAHNTLDRLVLAAYSLKSDATEADVLSELFMRYQRLTAELLTELTAQKPARRPSKK